MDSSQTRWDKLIEQLEEKRKALIKGKEFFDFNLYWQALYISVLTAVVRDVLNVCLAIARGERKKAIWILDNSHKRVSELLARRHTLAEPAYFRGWFDGEHYINLKSLDTCLVKVSDTFRKKDGIK